MQMTKEEENMHDAADNKEVELEHLIPMDEESGTFPSNPQTSMRSSSELGVLFSATSRWILFALREVVRAGNRSLKPGEAKTQRPRGVMATVFGFAASKHDEIKETSWLDGLRGVGMSLKYPVCEISHRTNLLPKYLKEVS